MPGCQAVVNNEPCTGGPTYGWQRWATEAEVVYYHGTGDLPLIETTARIQMLSCDDHRIADEWLPETHESTCTAPVSGGPCDCSVSGA